MQTLNNYLENIARRGNDFVDVVPVIGIPLSQRAERNGAAIVGARRDAVHSAHAIWLGVWLHGAVLGAAFDNGLESKRIEIDTSVLELDDQDMAKLCWN